MPSWRWGCSPTCAAVAWSQGVDLFGRQDNRILQGFEYTARYNLGDDSIPFTLDLDRTGKYLKTAISTINRGTFQPIYELAYGHYVSRRGLSAPISNGWCSVVPTVLVSLKETVTITPRGARSPRPGVQSLRTVPRYRRAFRAG